MSKIKVNEIEKASGSGITVPTGSTFTITDGLAQASIADQAINEAKLQISNAPTNGYFLSAQSGNTGGLTWAEAGGGGKIGQVIQTQKVDVYSQTAESWTDITGLSVAITPSATTSKILVTAVVNASKANGGGNGAFRLLRGSTVIGAGTSGSSYNHFGMTDQGVDGNTMSVKVNNYLDSPSSTSALTYKVQLYNITTSHASYVNRRAGGAGHGANSTITVMEVLA